MEEYLVMVFPWLLREPTNLQKVVWILHRGVPLKVVIHELDLEHLAVFVIASSPH